MSDQIQFVPPKPEELSQLINGYEVTDFIAQGGMGAIYRATQTSLDREVAIKLLPKEFGDAEFRELFQAEAIAMAKLNHDNLIAIYDFGNVEGMLYIAMEYVPGKSLYYSCYQKAIEQETALDLVVGISRGLAHAHEAGIIHRDIKPANILLDTNAKPKIGDFGLASPMDSDFGEDEVIYGTPGYAAPEITMPGGKVGVPSDIYAVGIVLYELLTGFVPIEQPVKPPSTVVKCDPRFDAIFKKATDRDPSSRYQTVAEFADELEALKPNLGKAAGTGHSRLKTAASATPTTPKLVPLKKGTSPSKPKLTPLPEGGAPAATTTAAPASETPAATTPKMVKQTGSNWPIIRNLIIIAALVPALIFAWGKYQEKKARLDAEANAEQREARVKEIENEAERKKAEENAEKRRKEEEKKQARIKAAETERRRLEAIEAKKTPRERLAELRNNLVSGRRDQFPKGSLERPNHIYFFIDTPMHWTEAADFAESHGGHLAVPVSQTDRDALLKKMGEEYNRVWIGAGGIGNKEWGWVNGEAWTMDQPSTALGSYGSLSSSGKVRARPSDEKNPFVIQWQKDGSNPGALTEQLLRLIPTLDNPSPAWPPGTITQGNRAFLFVKKNVSWKEAELIAASGEGHLAVVSNQLEGLFLNKHLAKALSPEESIWLGARLQNSTWSWVTGEPWQRPSWSASSPSGEAGETALRFLKLGENTGWDDVNPAQGNTQGFLIEWSKDRDAYLNSAGNKNAVNNTAAQLKQLHKIGARFLDKEIKQHENILIANKDNFIWVGNSWFKAKSVAILEQYEEHYKAFVSTLPENGDLSGEFAVGNLPEKLQEEFAKRVQEQVKIEKSFQAKLMVLRGNYFNKILELRDRLENEGLKAEIAKCDAEIQSLGQNADTFRRYFKQ